MGNHRGVPVKPRSTKNIRDIAQNLRKALGIPTQKVNLVVLLEDILPETIGLVYDVKEPQEMKDAHALTYPKKRLIVLRKDVYEGLHDGDPRDRFTVAHEIGHLLLHQRETGLARGRVSWKPYEDSEWQADTFAAEFLMPFEESQKVTSVSELMRRFGVSRQAAEIRLKKK